MDCGCDSCVSDGWDFDKDKMCQKAVSKEVCGSEEPPEGRDGTNGTTIVPPLQEPSYETIEELFELMDKDGDGTVDMKELREYLRIEYGDKVAEGEAKQVFKNYGKDESHKFTLEEVKNPPI